MKLAGILIILVTSVSVGFLLEREAGKGARQLSSFIAFLKSLRTRLECYLESPDGIAAKYTDPTLELCGFLPLLREGIPIREAYLRSRGALSLPDESDKLIEALFSSFGRGYLSSELRSLDGTIASLEEDLEGEWEKAATRGRAIKISAPTLGIGLVILFI